ncbi:MAG: hypothetical protein H6600_03155 [Flavobacteriales bacterium]|nr:hypothetical protein [Flavobacteriales bacterium]
MKLILIITIGILYIVVSTYAIFKIFSKNHLNTQQRWINSILIILIPFFYWGVLSSVLRPSPKGTSSKEYRENKGKVKYENHGNGAY